MNIKPYNNKERLLFPSSIGDYLADNHLAHVIDEAIELMDLTPYYRKISPVGNPAYAPELIIKILFYGYATKVRSSRKIAEKLETDVAFIYLAGMQKPDFRTISDFRKNNIDSLKKSFVDIVRICKRLGLVKLGEISIDSKVMKANASADRSYNEKELEKERETIEQEIQDYLNKSNQTDEDEDKLYGSDKTGNELPKDLDDKQKRIERMKDIARQLKEAEEIIKHSGKNTVNLTDHDTQFQRDKGRIIPGYRAEAVVDSKEQIIIAEDVSAEQDDHARLLPMIDETLENIDIIQPTGQQEQIKVAADCGYSTGTNLAELEKDVYKSRVDPYIPDQIYQHNQRTEKKSLFSKDAFVYDETTDEFICPTGNRLGFDTYTNCRNNQRAKIYRCNVCKCCKYFGLCTKSPRGRILKVSKNDHLLKQMRDKLSTPEGKRVYNKRKIIVEPVFGNLSQNLGYREFLLRTTHKVKGEFSLMCTAHNLLKISKHLRNLGKNLKEVMHSPESLVLVNTS